MVGGIVLTDAKIRKAVARDKEYKLTDGQGLYVLVRPNGSKLWRIKYRFDKSEKLQSLGPYPEVSLAEAREQLAELKKKLRQGEDPKRKRASSMTFERLARDWHAVQKPRWADHHAKNVLKSLEDEVFPELGSVSVNEIDAPAVLEVIRKIEARGAIETAARIRQRMSAAFVYGIAAGVASADPAGVIQKALAPPKPKGRRPALLQLDEIRDLLKAVEASEAYPVTVLASRFLALSAARPGMVRGMEWSEDHGDRWVIPATRMKLLKDEKIDSSRDFAIPITPQMREVLEAVRPLTGHAPLVFPGQRQAHKPLSENAIGYLYNRAGWHGRHVPHGWRASFSTIMNERLSAPGDREIIDLMLAHIPKDDVEAAYNRAQYWKRRVEIAEEWSTLISEGLPPPRAERSRRRSSE